MTMNECLSRVGKTLLIMAVVVGSIASIQYLNKDAHSPPTGQTSTAQAELPQSPANDFEDLLDAIEWVESKGDPNAVGDGGRAVGAYQLWKIYVDDCNRIHDKLCRAVLPRHPFYTYSDRWNKEKSKNMTGLYITYYWERTRTDMDRFEYMARIHNGGPNGWKKESTKPYWAKVKKAIEGR